MMYHQGSTYPIALQHGESETVSWASAFMQNFASNHGNFYTTHVTGFEKFQIL